MKERPIIFNGEMVRAILEGRKTQTRRVVKPLTYKKQEWRLNCPYGAPGDQLWVRETWAYCYKCAGKGIGGQFDMLTPKGVVYKEDRRCVGFAFETCHFINPKTRETEWKWRPSIHMPRWASRLQLEVTEVRVERVQEITAEDCLREGIVPTPGDSFAQVKLLFRDLWDSINAKRGYSWEANPWVWAVSFRRIDR